MDEELMMEMKKNGVNVQVKSYLSDTLTSLRALRGTTDSPFTASLDKMIAEFEETLMRMLNE